MFRKIAVVVACLAALSCLAGCLGSFAANQGRRQAARSADHYYRTYGEPELEEAYGNDPAAQAQMRQTRNDMADTIVRSGNDRYQNKVGVDDRGWLTNER